MIFTENNTVCINLQTPDKAVRTMRFYLLICTLQETWTIVIYCYTQRFKSLSGSTCTFSDNCSFRIPVNSHSNTAAPTFENYIFVVEHQTCLWNYKTTKLYQRVLNLSSTNGHYIKIFLPEQIEPDRPVYLLLLMAV